MHACVRVRCCVRAGVQCLLAPSLRKAGDESAAHMELLIREAGGEVLQSRQQALAAAEAAGHGAQQQQQPQRRRLLVVAAAAPQPEAQGDDDAVWARTVFSRAECWQLVSREWLLRCIMTYTLQ